MFLMHCLRPLVSLHVFYRIRQADGLEEKKPGDPGGERKATVSHMPKWIDTASLEYTA